MQRLRKVNHLVLVLLILSLVIIAGCAQGASSGQGSNNSNSTVNNEANGSETRVITHELGETKITGTPKRIVALEFSYVDALAALNIAPVGVADDNDPKRLIQPVRDKIGQYTSVGTRKQPSLEVISSLKPDLIIADLQRHKDIYDELQQIAPTIVLSSLSANYQGILDGFPVIAEAVGKKAEAQQILAEHTKKIEEFKAKVPAGEQRIVMPAVVSSDGFYAHSALAYTGSLLESIGLKNAIQDANGGSLEKVNQYNKINLEQVVAFNPDILFLIKDGENGTVVDEWEKSPLWQDIKAVKNGQVFEVERSVWAWSRGLISAETIIEDAIKQLYSK